MGSANGYGSTIKVPRTLKAFLRVERRIKRPKGDPPRRPRPEPQRPRPSTVRVATVAERLRVAAEARGAKPGDPVCLKQLAADVGITRGQVDSVVSYLRARQKATTGWHWPYRSFPRGRRPKEVPCSCSNDASTSGS